MPDTEAHIRLSVGFFLKSVSVQWRTYMHIMRAYILTVHEYMHITISQSTVCRYLRT